MILTLNNCQNEITELYQNSTNLKFIRNNSITIREQSEKENLSFTSVKLHTKALHEARRKDIVVSINSNEFHATFEEKIFARKPVFFESLVLFLSNRFEKGNESAKKVSRFFERWEMIEWQITLERADKRRLWKFDFILENDSCDWKDCRLLRFFRWEIVHCESKFGTDDIWEIMT